MKWLGTLFASLSLGSLSLAGAELSGAHSVYLMPMGRGLDQFIANRLTRMHVMRVVTDPAKADIIFTDQVGAQFEDRLNNLYPPPPTPEELAAAAKKKEAAAKDAEQRGPSGATPRPSLLGDTVNKADQEGALGVSGRGRGTLFLVDVKSRQVVWSAFEKPRNSTPHELDHTAERVVKLLKQDLSPATK